MSTTPPPSESNDTAETRPKAKKRRTDTNENAINYLAYEVEPTTAKTIRGLLLKDGVAKAAILVKSSNAVGLLISFKNWEQVAHFYEWCSKGDHTHQLMKTIRVPCGPIKVDFSAHNEAEEIIQKLAASQTITKEDLEIDFYLEQRMNDSVESGFTSFHQILVGGVFCHHCNVAHMPITPSY